MTSFGGRVSSLLTNYDITFWLLLASALEQRLPTEVEHRPCTALPFRKVAVRPLSPELARTMAALNLVLVDSKAADDQQDGARLKAGAARALFGKKFAKARRHLEEIRFPLDTLVELPAAQARVEKNPTATLQDLSAPTARALGEIFAAISCHHALPELADPLRDFGSSLGAYLYLWDALEDLDADRKKGDFNAIVAACGGCASQAGPVLRGHLDGLEKGLDGLALGPEGAVCRQLLRQLRQRLDSKIPLPRQAHLDPRRRLAQAGFVRQSCCGDGEVDCCNCGCCDCNLCNCQPCGEDKGNQCCECNLCPCTGDHCSCCCCSSSNTPRRQSSSCCSDLVCDDTPTAARQTSHGSGWCDSSGSSQRAMQGRSSRRCPACALNMVSLSAGQVDLEECRNCGGFWLDNKEIDELAKLPELPTNLLTRYPTQLSSMAHAPGQRPCPVCEGSTLVGVPYLDVPVEMCRKCHGFWLEHGLLRRVIQAKRSPNHLVKQDWRCPYCESIGRGDTCGSCGAPRPQSGFTGKLA